jgi:hypothetical protein
MRDRGRALDADPTMSVARSLNYGRVRQNKALHLRNDLSVVSWPEIVHPLVLKKGIDAE